MLGWRMLKSGDYLLDLPSLSEEEEKLVLEVQERFKEAAGKGGEDSEKLVADGIAAAAREQGLILDLDQQDYLARVAHMHVHGFAFFEQLIADDEIEEISVIGPKKPIYVFLRKVGWRKVNAILESEEAIADMINRMSRASGRHITLQNPRIDAVMPDGSRLHGSLPPISQGEITIRKFRDRPFSPLELIKNKTISAEEMALLSLLMQSDSSLIIAGNTASGKTSTMNALFSFVPERERIIISEQTPEINVPHRHRLRLVANREMGICLSDLVYDSLRMRPDRMIVGEVRSREEARALFDVLLAGQARGSYATFHAGSISEACARLKAFGIPQMDLGTIDCLIIQRRMLHYDRKRRAGAECRKVVQMGDVEGNPFFKGGRLCPGLRILEKLGQSMGCSEKELRDELRMRKRLILESPGDFDGFFRNVQGRLFGGN